MLFTRNLVYILSTQFLYRRKKIFYCLRLRSVALVLEPILDHFVRQSGQFAEVTLSYRIRMWILLESPAQNGGLVVGDIRPVTLPAGVLVERLVEPFDEIVLEWNRNR